VTWKVPAEIDAARQQSAFVSTEKEKMGEREMKQAFSKCDIRRRCA